MAILPLLQNHSFDPEQVTILAAAFDDAWETIKRSGSTYASAPYERRAREIIAEHILDLARRGLMDCHRLSAEAVAYLAKN
jgi:hypothetical protein